ncbi:MAG: DUF4347 domain-containing protein [Lentisphaeria bacterium]|nr:DUF4347 domain-containing protein [Lentisphaeria bacterium]
MKADEMKIFRLEDRILFEAAAAAEVVDAVQNDPGVNNTTDAEDKKSNEIEAVLNAPVENGNTTAGTVVDPADAADIDAQLNALIEGVIPQETQNDPVAVQLHDNGLTVSTGKELVVIDDSVKNIDSILAELSPDQDILILEKDNGLDELNDYLDSQDTVYSAIHFVTHGSKGEISINGDFISSENFDSSEWSKIGEHLTADGDLLFYGCEIAESEDGQTLLEQISAASDADVAASIDRTGLSGNWDLEYTTANIDTAVLTVDDYSGDLTEKSVSTYTELSNALTEAATNGGEYTITITQDISFDDEYAITALFEKDTDLTIKSANGKEITGTDGEGIFSFIINKNSAVSVSVSIENIVFTDGGSGNGDTEECAVYADDLTLTIKNSEFNNFDGGAVIFSSWTDTHQLKIEHSSFSNNSTTYDGGAISVNGASQVTISNSYFNGNKAVNGGAVSLETAGSATITNTTFYNNNAENGGAIYMETGTLNISNSTFYQNSATYNGGAISMFDTAAGNSSIIDTTFAANTAEGDGGAIYNDKGALTICNSLLIGEGGSVLYQDSYGETTVSYSLITSAKAADDGVLTIEKTTSEVNAAFTEQEVFGDNTYDTVNHTITPDAFHKAAWCGTAETGAKDQLGHDRNSINETLGITGKFTVGAVTAQAGILVTQNNATVTYTGEIITPDKYNVTIKYADGTDITKPLESIGAPASSPSEIRNVVDDGYVITPQDAVFSGVSSDDVDIKYISGTLSVIPVKMEISVSGTKVYDGTRDIGESTFAYSYTNPTGKFDKSWISVEEFLYNSKNVEGTKAATGKATLTDAAALKNYDITWNFSGSISKVGIVVGGITADDRVYDGTKDVQLNTTGATFTTMIAGDDLTVTNTTGTMDDKNAGVNKKVTLGELTLGGADAQNYFVAQGSQSDTSVNISKLGIVVDGITAVDRVYNGSKEVQLNTTNANFTTMVTDDNLTVTNTTGTMDDKNAGVNKKVTLGELVLGGADAQNYFVEQGSQSNTSVNIAKLGVTVSGITAVNRVYDGTKDVQLDTSGATFTTMVAGDILNVTTTGTMTDKNAGDNKYVALGTLDLGGADAQNYFVAQGSQSSTTVNIGKATLSLNVTVPDSKTYDGTVSVDAKVSANGIIQGDDVVLDLKWEYNSPNVAEADKITNVQYELSGAQAGNYQLPQDIPYRSVDGSITAKDVQVDFVTDAPYIFDGTDQSDSVSATITDVNGNKIDLVIDWNGKTFVEAGSYTVTAELRPADPNYKLVNNTLTLKMFAKTDNAFVVYTDGTASIYSATIPALQGSILAAGNADGSIYTMPWGELIAKAMLSYSRHFDGGDHPGMNYGSDHHELTVTVDTLKFRPMETDNIVRDAFEHLNFRETITKPQALYLGKELFIDSNHPESDYVALFEKRSSTYSPGHEPPYVERDYSADENDSMTFSSHMATLFLPGSFAKAEDNSAAENYDLQIQSSAVAEKAENMKSDLEKLLDELSHVS